MRMMPLGKAGRTGRMVLAVAGLLVLGTAAPAAAQGGGGGGGGPNMAARQQMLADSVVAGLHLTGDVAKKVTTIIMAEMDKRQKAMAGAQGDRQAMMAAMQGIQADTEKELGAVLNAEQVASYKEIRARVQPRRGRPGGNT